MEIRADHTASAKATSSEVDPVAQGVVFRVLSEYFGDAAYLATYSKLTTGEWAVDLTKLPHVDRGGPGAVIVFHTFKGQVTLPDMYKAIIDAQKNAGIAQPILPSITMLERIGRARG